MGRRALILVALFLLPLMAASLQAGAAAEPRLFGAASESAVDACAVPCGRIYPIITMKMDDKATMWNVTAAAPVSLGAVLTYQFDMDAEGYTVPGPSEPIVIRFEYPRLPNWANIEVEPESIKVPVDDPRYIQPDPSEPTSPQAQYVYSVPITITVTLLGQPVLRDGYDFAKLLVFAKSTESGLYQSGYGIKEIRVIPEGAVHESDIAGTRDVYTPEALPALDLQGVDATFAATTVSLVPPANAKFWEPAEFIATVSPAPAGRMVFALHDEAGALVAVSQPLDASTGEARLTATLAHPGLHTATLTLLPEPGTMTPPITYALDLDVGTLGPQGYVYPKTYLVTVREGVPVPHPSQGDPLAQFERDIPFFVFETAQSVSAALTLVTDAPIDLGRSLSNIQFSIHDPDGNLLQQGSVDPTRPTASIRVGSVPVDGWYVVRLKGLGAPSPTQYDARIEVNYAAPPQARSWANGAPDITGGLLGMAGANLTLPVDTMGVWAPSDATPLLQTGHALVYSLTIHDANGSLAYASGVRSGAASFSAPAPGTYRAYVWAEPVRAEIPFSPIVRAFTFDVGRGNTTIATTYSIKDGFEAPVAASQTLLGFHAVHVLAGASGSPTIEGAEIVDAEGNSADASAPGIYYLRVAAQGQPPEGTEIPVSLQLAYAAPVEMTGPGSAIQDPARGLPVPGMAIGLTLVAIGALAVGLALARK